MGDGLHKFLVQFINKNKIPTKEKHTFLSCKDMIDIT